MTRLGFVLDSGSCIGCHACTVACKAEFDVPLGVNRTWVKYVETGTFPETDRHFSVMRCNHCDDAPCITICPTGALFRADNGVVDFDDADCIGCKACMNACPYDAIYINPQTGTAHKCNFCNHRIADGLQPSCVIVCPTNAIRVGDLDDPDSEIARLHASDQGLVRSPEQHTRPKVIYAGADPRSLDPLASAIASDGLIWAETTADHPTPTPVALGASPPPDGDTARTTYTTGHSRPWGGAVAAYLVTKAVAAGVMLVASLLVILGHGDNQSTVSVLPPMVAGAFLILTGVLLVGDLKQPGRFHYLLTRGSRTSWLVKGAYVLAGFAACCAAWWIAGLTGAGGVLPVLLVPTVLLALGTAGYTAFLFAQCEGRDLWQGRMLLPVLLVQAVVAGAGAYTVLDLFVHLPEVNAVHLFLMFGLAANFALVVIEVVGRHTRHVTMAIAELTRGTQRSRFGAWVVANLAACLLVAPNLGEVPSAVGGLAALVGLFAYEDAYLRAGQSVPLS